MFFLLEKFETITSTNVKDKTIVLRVDINSSVQAGKLLISPKIIAHTKTIKHLSDKGAKLVVLSHQGRKGKKDFIDLQEHLKALKKLLKIKINFSKWNQNYSQEIKKLKKGEILLLDNTRFLDSETEKLSPEEHSENKTIKSIASNADFFVLDALSVAHRSHATVVGFIPLLPSFVGPVLENELKALENLEKVKDKTALILGGGKPKDSMHIMQKMLNQNKVSKVLLGGIIGELALIARGVSLGEKEVYLKEKNHTKNIPELKKILKKFEKKIFIPADVAISSIGERKEIPLSELPVKEMIFDVGEKTIKEYSLLLKNCELIIFNGPFGRFENYQFSWGTKEMLFNIKNSEAFSFVGGGDTITASIRLGFKREEFSHISLAGKALLRYLAGESLPALEALEKH